MYHVVIPARFGSTRLPGKALADINGFPMVYWVWQRAMASGAASVTVATDHDDIRAVMSGFGADVVMTRNDHPSGTDRLAEVASQKNWPDDTVVVNVQGDEPLMPPENIEQVAQELIDHPDASIATLSEPITDPVDFDNPAVVKVVCRDDGQALYFSRSSVPFVRDKNNVGLLLETARRHVGLYAYRCGFLQRFVGWAPSSLERLEGLEQLRALSRGEVIRVVPAISGVPAGVDTQEDLDLVRRVMGQAANVS